MSNHIFPAIERLQERARESVEMASVTEHGDPPESPEVSIVVPLYERIDLVEHQLLQFDRDPEIQAQELIYVLDSPELEAADGRPGTPARPPLPAFRSGSSRWRDNAGFGAATNAGASVARGRLLLLLNSDVLPAEPGWLGKMQAFHDATPNIGALGPKLLYEDDSLQHAGLYFEMVQEGPTAGSWANMHYFKGLHKDLPAANVARPVPAVTAACLMIEKELYEQRRGPARRLRAGRLRGLRAVPAAARGGARELVPARRGALPPRGQLVLRGRERHHRLLQSLAPDPQMGQAIEDVMARYPRI